MDIQLEKYKLLEWLIGLKDEAIISKIKELQSANETGWSQEISETEKLFIKAGLKDIDDGNTFSHNQVMEDIKRKYGF